MRAAQSVAPKILIRARDQPVDQRRFFEIRDSIQPRRHPIAGSQHVARDLRLHRVHVVHQRRRRDHAARVDRGGDQQNDQVEVKTLSIVPTCRPRRRSGLNSPFFHPKEQYHQSPQVITQVGAPVEMGLHMSFNSRELKKLAMFGGRECHGFFEQRPERSAKPVVRGNVKTDLLSIEDRRSELAAHQVPQDHLLARALDLHARRERACEFHDPMIEKRRPHFDRMRHAGVIHLGQDIIRQKVFLIEPEIVLQMAVRRRSSDASSCKTESSAGGSAGCTRARFSRSSNVPLQYTWARAAGIRQPSRNRFNLYSKPILSLDTGQRSGHRQHAPGAPEEAIGERCAPAGWRAASGIRRTIRPRLLR